MNLAYEHLPEREFRELPLFSCHGPGYCRVIALFIFLLLVTQISGRVVKVGIYMNPPKVYWGESGKPSGIFVEIMNHIAHAEGWEIEYHKDTWDNCLNMLQDGELDLMTDVAYNSERDEVMDFHQTPVLFSWTQFFARHGVKLDSFQDLEGLRLAVLENSVQ
ncbi:MAG: transporter substrate-binding domain-containing protein, partial [Candidatus Cloacimonetes bacterium]|nr:transporter substrate-binding domain-containing protein [Candidatus Cloacimonadota bacterium]